MSSELTFLLGVLAGLVGGVTVGCLVGLREGTRRGRPSWDEKRARELAAWQDGVRWGQHLEQNKAELGL